MPHGLLIFAVKIKRNMYLVDKIVKEMKKIAFLLAAVATLGFAACAQKKAPAVGDGKVLVAYFSATGTTEQAARRLADVTGGDLYEIRPAEAYTAADLDWHDGDSRSSVEMKDVAARPAIAGELPDVSGYDVVFVGFPIWWGVAPRIINTFLDSCDLAGKAVVPFATSGGSGLAKAEEELRTAYPALLWKEGKLLNRASDDDIKEWLNE